MDERTERNLKHLADPKPGDFWMDHGDGVCLVLDIGQFFVAYLATKQYVDSSHYTWDTTKVDVKSKADFAKWLSYDSIEGTWATVVPEVPGWEAFLESAKQYMK